MQKNQNKGITQKMVEQDDPEFTTSQGHTKVATACIAAHSENVKASRIDHQQLKS